jgi:hypothetical protein
LFLAAPYFDHVAPILEAAREGKTVQLLIGLNSATNPDAVGKAVGATGVAVNPPGNPGGIHKARAKELERLGLAKPVRRNVLAFSPNWQDRLKAMELHLDVAKRMAQARQAQSLTQMLGLGKGSGKER